MGGITVPGLGLLFPYRILALVLGVVLLFKSKRADFRPDKKVFNTVLPLAFVMMLLAIVSLIWAEDKLKTVKAIMNFFFVLVFLFIFLRMSKDKKVFQHMLVALTINFALILLMGVYESFTANYLLSQAARLSYVHRINPYGFRYPSVCFTNTNDLSFNIVLFAPLMLYTLDEIVSMPNWLKKALKIAVIILSFFVLLNTSSRIGYAAYLLSMFIYLGMQIKKSKSEVAVLVVLIGMVIISQVVALPHPTLPSTNSPDKVPVAQDKLTSVSPEDTSTDVRITVLKKGLRIIRDTYGLGAGAKNSPSFMAKYTDLQPSNYDVTDYHFLYMELIAEYGVLILVWFLAFQGFVFIKSIALLAKRNKNKDNRSWAYLCLPSAVGLVFASATSSSCLFLNGLWIILALWSYMLLHSTEQNQHIPSTGA